jgi:hypothetical protein
MKLKFEMNSFQKVMDGINSAQDLHDLGSVEFNSAGRFAYEEIININIKLIEQISSDMPEILEVVDVQGLDADGANFGSMRRSTIKLKELIEFLLESKLSEEIEQNVSAIVSETQKIKLKVESSAKLVTYTCQNPEATNIQVKEVLQKTKEDLANWNRKIESLQEKLTSDIRSNLIQIDEILESKMLITRANKLDRYVKRETTKRGWKNSFRNISNSLETIYYKMVRGYLNKREELENAQFNIKNESNQNLHAEIRDFVERIAILPQVEDILPFYYKQLFLGRHGILTLGEGEKSKEELQFELAMERHASGMDGAILVTGNAGSGYTSTAESMVAGVDSGKYYVVNGPERSEGISKESWEKAMFSSAEVQNWPEYKTKLNPGDRIHFKDIELWFLKGSDNEVFEELLDFIRTYGGKLKICLTCGIEFYKYVRKLTSFDSVLQSTIITSPVSLKSTIKEITHRHHSGGMKMVLEGKSFEQMNKRQVNQLLRRYHSISNGHIGAALHLWLANITSVKNDTIFMRVPSAVDLPVITNPDWLILLNEMQIHKEMTMGTGTKVFRSDTGIEVNQMFQSLIRCGLLIESNKTFTINPYAEMYVQQLLVENGLI